jgi:hypothetical protein
MAFFRGRIVCLKMGQLFGKSLNISLISPVKKRVCNLRGSGSHEGKNNII